MTINDLIVDLRKRHLDGSRQKHYIRKHHTRGDTKKNRKGLLLYWQGRLDSLRFILKELGVDVPDEATEMEVLAKLGPPPA